MINGQNPYALLFPSGPLFDTPLTRISERCINWQNSQCAELERRFWLCMQAVGTKRVQYYCAKEIDDFNECQTRTKEQWRYAKMQEVRKSKGLPFEPTPPDYLYKESY